LVCGDGGTLGVTNWGIGGEESETGCTNSKSDS